MLLHDGILELMAVKRNEKIVDKKCFYQREQAREHMQNKTNSLLIY